jgi:hypothetical protein
VHMVSEIARSEAGYTFVMHDRANDHPVWAQEIRGRRRELGLRQDELAALAGVSIRFGCSSSEGTSDLELCLISG